MGKVGPGNKEEYRLEIFGGRLALDRDKRQSFGRVSDKTTLSNEIQF